jgi:dolichyl-phosphate beta-glucosyltransferase
VQQHPDADIISDTHKRFEELAAQLNIEGRRKRNIALSIVIPGYNEQNRLPKIVLETICWCAKNALSYELILVDDGSTDDTLSLAKLFADRVSAIRYIACPHLGKGATVRMGMLNALGQYVLFMDADGATPLDEIPKLRVKLEAGSDVAIGSRVSQNPDDTRVITSLHRKIIGRIFATLVNIFAIPGFADTQCGFKMFRQEIIKEVFSRQTLNGFAFDVEILYIAQKLGLSIVEVPVNWVNQEGSKVHIIPDSLRMLWDILRIRWLHRNEDWRKPSVEGINFSWKDV